MQVIRTCKYAILRRLIWAIVLVVLCAVPAIVLADKPPKELFQAVTSTAQLIHRGECNVKSMNMTDVPCLIFYDGERDIVWLVLFDKDKDGNPYVTHVLMVDEIGKEVVAWCHERVCV